MRSLRSLLWNIFSKIFSFLTAGPTAFMNMRGLRYYATFKGRKFECLFYKINTCLQKTTTCRQTNVLSKFIIYMFCFCVPLLCYFQKYQLLVVKKFWTNFCCIVLLYLWAQKMCLRFLKSYFKLKILIFLSFVMSFLVDMFN